MRIDEYARHDALGLAELVKRAEITPRELANVAADAIAAINPQINAVIELYHDRVDLVDEIGARQRAVSWRAVSHQGCRRP